MIAALPFFTYLVVLKVRGISILEGRVSTDTILIAKILSASSTVNIGNQLSGRSLKVSDELVPIGLELLAVSAL